MTLPAFSAFPSTESVTSNSFSAILLALTLIWMLIAGCCCCGASEAGAFGFSKERSLVYCANTFNWGGAAASGGVPLPLVIKLLLERFWRAEPLGAGEFARGKGKAMSSEWLSYARLFPQG